MMYIWLEGEYGASIRMGRCMSRQDAIDHLRQRAGHHIGDHHFTPDRLKVLDTDDARAVAQQMFNVAEVPKQTS